jgi:hypothetical protein
MEYQIFSKMYGAQRRWGLSGTYAARGNLKRSMIEVGFLLLKNQLLVPPGKEKCLGQKKK